MAAVRAGSSWMGGFLALFIAGCSEPRFLDEEEPSQRPPDGLLDASAPDDVADADSASMPIPAPPDPEPDAGSRAVPAWALPLLGSYAARSSSFWQDNLGIMMTVDELALAFFEREGDRMTLRMQLCRQTSTSLGVLFSLTDATHYPELRREVLFDEDSFRTDSAPLTAGYRYDAPPECAQKGGELVPKVAMQPWNESPTCRCPLSPMEPPRLEDCRVSDPDEDGAPGFSYRLWLSQSLARTHHLANVIRSHHLRGRVMPDRHHVASLRVDEVSYQLSRVACSSGPCTDIAPRSRPCSSSFNGTAFVPLEARPEPAGGWSCASILAAEQELFPAPASGAPRSCSLDVLTDDPHRR